MLLCAFALAALPCRAAFEKGGSAYTKRLETALLAEPKPFAASVAKIEFSKKLKIEELRGSWLRVSLKEPKASGWVYAGNVCEDEPVIPPATGMGAGDASQTATAAAARPLTRIAGQYAGSHGLSTGSNDWLGQIAASVTDEDVTRYLAENKRGEYKQ